jgi:hypothetical protein
MALNETDEHAPDERRAARDASRSRFPAALHGNGAAPLPWPTILRIQMGLYGGMRS